MPNWCSNTLIVSGPRASLRAFELLARDQEAEIPLSFHSLVPEPLNLANEDRLAWRRENWGTKWDLDENTSFFDCDDSLEYIFCTAWGPPRSLINHLVKTLEHLHLTYKLSYYELGCDFYGEVCRGADSEDDLEYESSISADSKKGHLPGWLLDDIGAILEEMEEDE